MNADAAWAAAFRLLVAEKLAHHRCVNLAAGKNSAEVPCKREGREHRVVVYGQKKPHPRIRDDVARIRDHGAYNHVKAWIFLFGDSHKRLSSILRNVCREFVARVGRDLDGLAIKVLHC